MPKVTVLIISFNEKEGVAGLLAALAKQSFKDFEIIVCDNDSRDGTVEMLKKRKVRVLRSPRNSGFAVFNLALPHIRGKYVLTIAPDMRPDKNALRELVRVMDADDSVGMAAPMYLTSDGKPNVSYCRFSMSFYTSDVRPPITLRSSIEVPHVGNGLIRTSVIKTFGYIYDPDYFLYNEDMDLGLRIRLRRMKSMLVGSARIGHAAPSTTPRTWTNPHLIYLAERNGLITFFKVCSLPTMILSFPYLLCMRLIGMARSLLRLRLREVGARIAALLWPLWHPLTIARKRRETQKRRLAGDDYVFALKNERAFWKIQLGR